MTDQNEDLPTQNFLKAIADGKLTPEQLDQLASALTQAAEEADPEDSSMGARRARSAARADLPATYVDTWATLTWRGHIRMVLGESFKSGARYRAAFVMTLDDAQQLADYILETVEERRQKDSATRKTTPEDD